MNAFSLLVNSVYFAVLRQSAVWVSNFVEVLEVSRFICINSRVSYGSRQGEMQI